MPPTPGIKRYLSEVEPIVPNTWWSHEECGHTDEAMKEIMALFPGVTPFSTPKPERLMSRIIHIASNPGDLVLDCFLGSGTTAAVAHKMGRRWIGVEREADTVDSYGRGERIGGVPIRLRPHRGLELQVPERLAPVEEADGVPDIERRDLLGGLVHEYRRAA